jgi:hypothetical protein
MKIRMGFVSNSSSSSFLIAYNDIEEKTCQCCGHTVKNCENALKERFRDYIEFEFYPISSLDNFEDISEKFLWNKKISSDVKKKAEKSYLAEKQLAFIEVDNNIYEWDIDVFLKNNFNGHVIARIPYDD